jgi:sulfite exporter TauE/SafE
MSGWLGYIALAALLAGLAGGVHCAAMCGPIAAMCSGTGSGRLALWQRALAYNGGRIASYTVAGALAGAFGQAGLALRGGHSAQTIMAVLAGTTMLVLALHLAGCAPVTRRLEAAGGVIWRRLQPHAKHFLPADTFARALGLGALWGWLPCGMVYAVLVTAVATADAAQGALVMLAFGAGTLPNMLAITLAAGRLKKMLRLTAVRLFAAAVVAGFGTLGLSFAVHAHAPGIADFLCRFAPA